jgi:hypothetical protein
MPYRPFPMPLTWWFRKNGSEGALLVQLSHISSKKVNPFLGLKILKTGFLFLVIYDKRKTEG